MTTLEVLLVTATTLERIEDLLIEPCERDILTAVRLAKKEVVRMVDDETLTPGRYDGLAD